ncbi:MAG: hypothetical protein ABI742_05790 [Gemmatimonadota bacterium]
MAGPVLRPLSLGEMLDVSFGLYRSLFVPLLVVTIVTRALPLVLSVYLESAGGGFSNPVLYFASLVLSAVLSAIAAGASTFIIAENYMGGRITAGEAFRRATPFTGRLISLAIMTTLLCGLAFILLIIPVAIVGTGLALGTPALVLENKAVASDAMGRSWSLTRGYRWKLFIALAVVIFLLALPFLSLGVYAAASIPAGAQPAVGDLAGFLGFTIAAALLQTLIYPLLYCLLTVAYYDLRVRKEAFDLEVLAAGLTAA